jgi:methionyl aminopeptidase
MDSIKALRDAGRIASTVRNKIIKLIKPGEKIIAICEEAEKLLLEMGGEPAFPLNVDINHVAAHYTSSIYDEKVIPEQSLVKLDLGVHIDGYIADTAITVCLNPELGYLVDAAEAALNTAINTIKAGVNSKKVGAAIEESMRMRGLQPIKNLTGHKMSRYILHAGKSIPNTSNFNGHILNAGEVYAIEPFSVRADAAAFVNEGPPSNIYRFVKKRSLGNKARKMLKCIQEEYGALPFASRWILKKFSEGEEAFNELEKSKCIYGYPQLVERSRSIVAQAEHTIIVTEDGCEVTTA